MNSSTTLELIDTVDAFARAVFFRVKTCSSPVFTDVAPAVRQLHLALRHLRVEAADPDSLLRGADASPYSRQLRPIVEDCDFALKQLETILEKFDRARGRERDDLMNRITAVRSRLVRETASVEAFLDTVQLQNPANNAPEVVVLGEESNLEGIKDKVDNIATRLFHRWNVSGINIDDEDHMWQEFKSELEMEGFSSQVLHRHKEVLRAYIRELQSQSSTNGGPPPTVRGLLEQATMAAPPPLPPKEPLSPKEKNTLWENEKCIPSMKNERRMPDHAPTSRAYDNERLSFSSDNGANDSDDSLALISTKDLMTMDDMNSSIAMMHLTPYNYQYRAPQVRGSPNLPLQGISGSWPPPHMNGGQLYPTHSLSASPRSAYANPEGPATTTAQERPMMPSSVTGIRLAPDRYGKQIPLDAPWTKIRRSLVSPEVLEHAGVRYEARPEYVAILGRLTREQVAEYAKQSAACRAARTGRYPPARPRTHYYPPAAMDSPRSQVKDDDDSVLWDESDETDYSDDQSFEKGTKRYPYIVSPPAKTQTSPTTKAMPKPILKNKNENHVRFDPDPQEIEIENYRLHGDDFSRRNDNGTRKHRGTREPGRRDDKSRWDDDRQKRPNRSERERKRKEERHMNRKTWGETIGAVSIGGAAASLLGVLTEAAVGF